MLKNNKLTPANNEMFSQLNRGRNLKHFILILQARKQISKLKIAIAWILILLRKSTFNNF